MRFFKGTMWGPLKSSWWLEYNARNKNFWFWNSRPRSIFLTCVSVESTKVVEFIRDSRGRTVFSHFLYMYDSRQSEKLSFVELWTLKVTTVTAILQVFLLYRRARSAPGGERGTRTKKIRRSPGARHRRLTVPCSCHISRKEKTKSREIQITFQSSPPSWTRRQNGATNVRRFNRPLSKCPRHLGVRDITKQFYALPEDSSTRGKVSPLYAKARGGNYADVEETLG